MTKKKDYIELPREKKVEQNITLTHKMHKEASKTKQQCERG